MIVRYLDVDLDLAEQNDDHFVIHVDEGICQRLKNEQGGDFMTRTLPDASKFRNVTLRVLMDHRAIVQYGAESYDGLEALYAGDRRQAQDAQRECAEWAERQWDETVVWNADMLWRHCVQELDAIHLYKGSD